MASIRIKTTTLVSGAFTELGKIRQSRGKKGEKNVLQRIYEFSP